MSMNGKEYTAEEMLEVASMDFHAVKLGMDDRPNLTEEIKGMLLQAAEYLKKGEK